MLHLSPRSIRSTLLLLVLAAMMPALIILLQQGLAERHREAERARSTAILQVLHFAEQEEHYVTGVHQLLSALAAFPAIQAGDSAVSSRLLANLLAENPQYATLLLTDAQGTVIASALPVSERISLADRKYFQNALRSKAFSTGEFVISRTAHRRIFSFSLPLFDKTGQIKGILAAGQDLDASDALFPRLGLPDGADFVMVDHQGVILHQIASPGALLGEAIPVECRQALFGKGPRGTFRAHDSNGVPRLYAFQALYLNDPHRPYLVLRIGIPERIALAENRRAFGRNMLAMGLAFLGAMGLAWMLGGILVQRPVRQLLIATLRLARGDWTAPSKLPSGRSELGHLAAALKDLGVAVHSREAVLHSREQTLRMLFDSVNDGIFVHDAHSGAILAVNQKACELYGYSQTEIHALDPESLHAGETSSLLARIRKTAQGEPQLFEGKARHRSGQSFWVEFNMRRAQIDEEDRVLAVVRDIQGRKEAEQERRRLELEVQQAQKLESLGVMAGGIAHDFNNLLTAILGNLNLAKDFAAEGEGDIFLEKAERAALRAADLTKQMLTYAGRGRADSRPMALNRAVHEMSNLLNVSISKKIRLELQLATELPSFKGDAAQIQQVVMNLVTNAAEAIGDGEGLITLSTARRELHEDTIINALPGQPIEPGVYVMLEVRDTGCGMPPELQARIFEPFFTTKASGRGLGLSAMLGILKAHRGAIQILTQPGKGTTFRIYFPTCQADAPECEPEPIALDEFALEGHVLLVEDEASIRESTRMALERLGLRVSEAEDGQAGLEAFQRQPNAFDLVLMDLTMPRLNGREAFRAIRSLRPETPIILCSGYDESSSTQNLMEEGLAAFIPKPYVLKDLARAIQKCIPGSVRK